MAKHWDSFLSYCTCFANIQCDSIILYLNIAKDLDHWVQLLFFLCLLYSPSHVPGHPEWTLPLQLCCAIILSLSKTLVHSWATSAWHDSNSHSNSQIRHLEILFSNSRWASFAWMAVSMERNQARDQLNQISNLYQWIVWNVPLVSCDASLPLYS